MLVANYHKMLGGGGGCTPRVCQGIQPECRMYSIDTYIFPECRVLSPIFHSSTPPPPPTLRSAPVFFNFILLNVYDHLSARSLLAKLGQ